MQLQSIGPVARNTTPLTAADCPKPAPSATEILIRVSTCGVCHTVVGTVESLGAEAHGIQIGDRVGVAWIYSACGHCFQCRRGAENLCPDYQATGRDKNGGYAEYMTVPAAFAYKIPDIFSDTEAAPLLCAGAIGYRSLRLTGLQNGRRLGLTGFGGSAHLVLKLVRHQFPESHVYVFARGESERAFAIELGATWAGEITQPPPQKLHAIIDTTPAWLPILSALENLEPGGRLVINAIRKEETDKTELLKLDYAKHLWLEKEIKSVANVTRADVREFLQTAAEIPLHPQIQEYPLEDANQALIDLKSAQIRGSKVLRTHEP
jgi:propanol-preferring alcohol dehydrogenase